MAKPGLNLSDIQSILRDLAKKEGWVLCVGAGISTPMFPSWVSLVERLVAQDISKASPEHFVQDLLGNFSPDAMIQAAKDRLELNDAGLRDLLVQELYRNIQKKLTHKEFQLFCDILASDRPVILGKESWLEFLSIIRSKYPHLTALSIATVLSEIIGTEIAPLEVLSFNAEPMLIALCNALKVEEFANKPGPIPEVGDRRMIFDYVTHSFSRRRADRIPYVFCHGLLPVPDPSGQQPRIDSMDKLVFSESSYLQLANTSFAWQSSVFLEASSIRHIVFVGVSLSDSNMRRWLAWAHENRQRELAEKYGPDVDSTAHYWITRHPGKPEKARWIESAVGHLGVRIVWVPDWNSVDLAMRRLLGLA